ncbi:hypothetical protein K1T71_006232 [Dendrolimus kikuchii]|uniref:Uncharacterized protein n=1 Tax=Dendrolimus kikuchii TaxID=765133 RepID=A0ACC1D381_9NEOP|nr:hypothetical protein K1T71_006232 [Dendrolimus kikuchii]
MEILNQISNAQLMFTVAAVAVVLVCAALVFVFGFHSAEQPQFDKLPLVVDDKKSSKKKPKKDSKKSSPNRIVSDDVKPKEASKKSPAKEKKEEKPKEVEKPKPKERPAEPKVKKDVVSDAKKGKKKVIEVEKPADFDDGLWEEVPKKSEKKKVKGPEEKKKESPTKKTKKAKDADVEAAITIEEPIEETIKVVSAEGPNVDEDAAKALQAQVEELQRVLKERERRDQAVDGEIEDESPEVEELTDVKDLRSNKKKENKEKQSKKKSAEPITAAKGAPKAEPIEKDNSDSDKQEEKTNPLVFDELGDTWTDAKASKKSKKKARKDQ